MPKYRTLTSEELSHLEKEFVEFLVVNGITSDEWQKIKESEPEKTDKLIVLFSDVVFEKLMRKTHYVNKQMGKVLMCFHYGEQEAQMILVQDWELEKPASEVTFNDLRLGSYSLSTQTKKYKKLREVELFELVQGGAEISDGKIYRWFWNKLQSNEN